MKTDLVLLAGGLVALVVAALSDRTRRLPISEPLLGLLAGIVLGPAVAGLLDVRPLTEDHAWLHTATRILLAISVMAVALRYPLGAVRAQVRPVVLLLAIAMPLMAVITAGLSAWVLGMGVGAAVLLGAALCPTDPVVASSVVTGGPAEEDLPARDRQVLSLESGANDGLALPLVLAAVAIAGPLTAGEAASESLWQVAGAVVVRLATGWLGGLSAATGLPDDAARERLTIVVLTGLRSTH